MSVPNVHVMVWGDFACFTRPELKVERVSYPLMTPSAARGILEAIYWEPEFYFLVHEIGVVRHKDPNGCEYGKGQWLNLRRNEVQAITSISTAKSAMKGKKGFDQVQIHAGGGAEDATQRNSLLLQHVAYLITAEIHLSRIADPKRCNLQKYYERFRSRAQKGKCYYRPALGCREFAADFEWCDDPDRLDYINWEENLGIMLYDVFDPNIRSHGFSWFREDEIPETKKSPKKRPYHGELVSPQPVFFRAKIEAGRMKCHPAEIDALRHSD